MAGRGGTSSAKSKPASADSSAGRGAGRPRGGSRSSIGKRAGANAGGRGSRRHDSSDRREVEEADEEEGDGEGQEEEGDAGGAGEEEEEERKSIPPQLLTRLLHEFFERDGTRITKDANEAVARYMDVFVREAIARTAAERDTRFMEVR